MRACSLSSTEVEAVAGGFPIPTRRVGHLAGAFFGSNEDDPSAADDAAARTRADSAFTHAREGRFPG